MNFMENLKQMFVKAWRTAKKAAAKMAAALEKVAVMHQERMATDARYRKEFTVLLVAVVAFAGIFTNPALIPVLEAAVFVYVAASAPPQAQTE